MEKVKELFILIKDKKEELSQQNKFYKRLFIFLYIIFSYSFCFIIYFIFSNAWFYFTFTYKEQIIAIFGNTYPDDQDSIIPLLVLFFGMPLLYISLFSKNKPSIHPVIMTIFTITLCSILSTRFDISVITIFYPLIIISSLITQLFYFFIVNLLKKHSKHSNKTGFPK